MACFLSEQLKTYSNEPKYAFHKVYTPEWQLNMGQHLKNTCHKNLL